MALFCLQFADGPGWEQDRLEGKQVFSWIIYDYSSL